MKSGTATPSTIDEYIASFSPDVRHILSEVRSAVRRAAPDATEKISYGMPTLDYNGNLVHFAAFKQHIGFFPTPRGITAFDKELAGYKTSKGGVQFPLDQPLPLDLIARIVKFRVGENAARTPSGRKASK